MDGDNSVCMMTTVGCDDNSVAKVESRSPSGHYIIRINDDEILESEKVLSIIIE